MTENRRLALQHPVQPDMRSMPETAFSLASNIYRSDTVLCNSNGHNKLTFMLSALLFFFMMSKECSYGFQGVDDSLAKCKKLIQSKGGDIQNKAMMCRKQFILLGNDGNNSLREEYGFTINTASTVTEGKTKSQRVSARFQVVESGFPEKLIAGNSILQGIVEELKEASKPHWASEWFATADGRIFFGESPIDMREFTQQMTNDAFSEGFGKHLKSVELDLDALPYLTMSSMYTESCIRESALSYLRLAKYEFEEESGEQVKLVVSTASGRVVMVYTLAKEFDLLPIRTDMYLRDKANAKDSIDLTKRIGEHIYQTITEWDRDAPDQPWLPKRVSVEELPQKQKPGLRIIEIDAVWKTIQNSDVVSPQSILGKVDPNPIESVYSEMEKKLELAMRKKN
jgi:hypothetical protein